MIGEVACVRFMCSDSWMLMKTGEQLCSGVMLRPSSKQTQLHQRRDLKDEALSDVSCLERRLNPLT